uniref:Nuclear RNA export factor 1 n=2 Tax=Drosophila melanogaster TaxID=7227 RepID=NXF1_DROME|nr:small bristles, isoform A [Drosophila melanogaster]Q9U1H9.2 RecName: Full=Nuclear RNA export factor 1; AltName: Full=Protein small bristles; AltName: Full=Protein tip-associating [Drosophila melanogaster]AAF47959.3 small bristles, isoform A [Drosophila melanogaster]CAB64382.2 tip associating protein [Drosophila melanogaster]CAC41645.1 nuclear RNA export factor 1 (NXF1) [Drosophila melanogaster]|eukprot:NP_524660.1 small bristles [Drosophila melanogaster]
MPKRGGGSSQRYNNNVGNGGGRYNAPEDFDDFDVEDRQRRKDRNKRRVSFKPSQCLHNKKDIKLRPEDLRRWDEDDDMSDMTTAVKDRPTSRRRGSPIPRGKFGKLMPNSFGWYQVTLQNAQIYEKETLLSALLAAMSPHVFIPQYWRVERNCVIFFTDDYEAAERIQHLGKNGHLPDGYRLMPRVRSGIPLVAIDDAFKEKMKVTMAKRYNIQTKALDLSRFHADPDLKQVFCPLFRQNVMGAAIDIMCDNIPDLEALNLNDNSISSMEAFKGVEKRLPNLKILYLGDNKIPSLAHLVVLRNLSILELVLKNNPCRSRYKDSQQFISEVRRKFPKLVKLDGETLEPQITFDLSEQGRLLETKASYLCDVAGAEVVRQFLDQYFRIFDSGNRQALLDAYHEKAMLSISMPSASQAGRLNSFWKFNRNLRRLLNGEENRTRNLKYGRLACVSTLDEWPKTQHDRRTFTVDLTIYNTSMMVFTVTGLFKELNDETNNPASMELYDVRHFARTYVVVPQNNGFCIRNETIFITNATHEQVREFKRSQHQPAPGAMPSTSSAVTSPQAGAAAGLQGRLNALGVATGPVAILSGDPLAATAPVNSGSAAISTTAVAPGAQDESTKMQMIEAMSAQSQMNVIWSRKCLEETNWDFNHAAFVFEKLFKENKIPPEAFMK